MATLLFANEKVACTFIDRASFPGQRNQIKLQILVEGDEAMFNYITLIPVNPKTFPKVNYEDAMTYAKWLTNPKKGKKSLGTLEKINMEAYSLSPNSKEWWSLQGINN